MAKLDAAMVAVGFLMLENLQLMGERIGGALLPETMIPDTYEPALNEFKDLYKNNKGDDFEPPDHFRQMCIEHVTVYLETKGHLQ